MKKNNNLNQYNSLICLTKNFIYYEKIFTFYRGSNVCNDC